MWAGGSTWQVLMQGSKPLCSQEAVQEQRERQGMFWPYFYINQQYNLEHFFIYNVSSRLQNVKIPCFKVQVGVTGEGFIITFLYFQPEHLHFCFTYLVSSMVLLHGPISLHTVKLFASFTFKSVGSPVFSSIIALWQVKRKCRISFTFPNQSNHLYKGSVSLLLLFVLERWCYCTLFPKDRYHLCIGDMMSISRSMFMEIVCLLHIYTRFCCEIASGLL